MELWKSGLSSGVGYRWCSRDKCHAGTPKLCSCQDPSQRQCVNSFEQVEINCGNQTVPHFELFLDDIAEHVFPEKDGQIQKHYMQRNLQLVRGMTMKEWVA
eukprot:11712763-Ditylum_brightwellii.AAC.1